MIMKLRKGSFIHFSEILDKFRTIYINVLDLCIKDINTNDLVIFYIYHMNFMLSISNLLMILLKILKDLVYY